MSPVTVLLAAGSTATDGEDGAFLVSPDAGAVAFTIVLWAFALVALACAGVLIAKRRWGWLLIGLVTGGLGWFAAFVVDAVPGSPWARRVQRRRGAPVAPPRGSA